MSIKGSLGSLKVRTKDGSFKPINVIVGDTKETTDAIKTLGDKYLADLKTKNDTYTSNIQTKGQQALASIPEDYSQLSESIVKFQSTHPRGMRPCASSSLIPCCLFQSTHPRGMRRDKNLHNLKRKRRNKYGAERVWFYKSRWQILYMWVYGTS